MGDVVGIAVSLDASDGASGECILPYRLFEWRAPAAATPTVALRDGSSRVGPGGLDYSEAFDGQIGSVVTGDITEVEIPDVGTQQAAILMLHDSDNLLHRVLVEPADLVARILSGFDVGESMTAEGVLTRDDGGKLLVASVVTSDQTRLELRNAEGAIDWDALAARFQSARRLTSMTARSADGADLRIAGWFLDVEHGVVPFVCLEVDGVERALPWSDWKPGRERETWDVMVDMEGLSALPVVRGNELIIERS